jgi:hypothetical protein
MAVERVSAGTSLIDVLDRVLDKGIVIDAWVRISLVGIDLVTVEARVVVASIETYLRYAEQVSTLPPLARPASVEPPIRATEAAPTQTRARPNDETAATHGRRQRRR